MNAIVKLVKVCTICWLCCGKVKNFQSKRQLQETDVLELAQSKITCFCIHIKEINQCLGLTIKINHHIMNVIGLNSIVFINKTKKKCVVLMIIKIPLDSISLEEHVVNSQTKAILRMAYIVDKEDISYMFKLLQTFSRVTFPESTLPQTSMKEETCSKTG